MKESTLANGRIGVFVPGHPYANNRGYVLRYRYVMEQHLGRVLSPDETIHHKNGNSLDDSLANLEVLSRSDHARLHNNLGGTNGGRARVHNWDRIRELHTSGLGCRKIAALMGCTPHAVKYACKQMGLRRHR